MTYPCSDFVRFMSMVAVQADTSLCWEWLGSKPVGKYGHFSVGGKAIKAHRWIYENVVGEIPTGLIVRHKCDNPSCVNPDHLIPGTHSDNMVDMVERGRNPDRKGKKHPLARLSDEDVLEIRRLKSCGLTQERLSEQFNISTSQIGKIVHRINWRHLP